jgi:hypothetical protein
MAIDTGKKYTNEHPKFSMFEKYKADKDSLTKNVKVAEITDKDISLSKSKGFSKLDLKTAKMLSGNPTLTQEELDSLKKQSKDTEKIK